MAYTHSNLPIDGRGEDSFNVIKGTGWTTMRGDFDVRADVNSFTISVGEVVGATIAGSGAKKIGDATPAANAEVIGAATTEETTPLGMAWDAFSTERGYGFPNANWRGNITVLTGSYIVRLRAEDWFVTKSAQIGGGIDNVNGFVIGAVDPTDYIKVGQDVVAVKTVNGDGAKLITLLSPVASRYAGANPTAAEKLVDKSVIGKVINIFTDDDDNKKYVEIRVKF